MDLKLEVVVLPVTDVDKAKEFYGVRLGCREDIDVSGDGGFRCVQMTPPGSPCSVIFGSGVTSAAPGSLDRLVLVVDDIEKARAELVDRGVDVGGIFHDAAGGPGGGFVADAGGRAAGPHPERLTYASYALFADPDGNVWMLQEVTERLPGRV
jgi:catechol 2,3-dioxygenase-like lactoylglutathione lyase family enzyme